MFTSQKILNYIKSIEPLWRKHEKKILKEMKNEIHPWQKILGKKKFDKIFPYAKGYSTRVYSIPEKSNEFVKKAWKEWN